MKIQLVHPPVYLNVYAMTALRPSLPLGLAYVAAALRQAGHAVSVVDAVGEAPDQVTPGLRRQISALGLTPDQLVERLDPAADAFGVTNMWSFSWPVVREIIQKIKVRFPNTPIVCGGEHFTATAEHSMGQAPIDYIVLGEGEETAIALFRALEMQIDATVIPGIAWRRQDGSFVQNERRDRIRDIDDLPWPAWHLFDIEAYDDNRFVTGIHYGRTVPILATRGCPYQCTYCSSPGMWTTRWYARTPESVADEIEFYVHKYGAANFPFQDLTAILRRDWIVAFCQELLRRRLPITWQLPSGTRCEVVDDEIASLLQRTGGRHLAFAPESGSEETRRRIKKHMRTDKLLGAVRAAVRHKLSLSCFLVLGFPEDTPQDLKESVRLARRLARMGVTDIAVGYFFPIPNTELYRQLFAAGRITLDDAFLQTPMFANDPFLQQRNNYCAALSAARLSFTKHWIVANFYAISFLLRPWRLARVIGNVLRGRETSKLETFLIELRRKLWIFLRRPGFGHHPSRAPGPALGGEPARGSILS